MTKRALLVHSIKGRGHQSRMDAVEEEMRLRGWTVERTTGVPEYLLRIPMDRDAKHLYDAIVLDGHRPQWDGSSEHEPAGVVVQVYDRIQDMRHADIHWSTSLSLDNALIRRAFRGQRTTNPQGVFDGRELRGVDTLPMALGMLDNVVVTGGGVRSVEAATVGSPAVIVVQSDDQIAQALALVQAGAAVIAPDKEAFPVAWTLLKDRDVMIRMSQAARKVVDGRGAERLVSRIEDILTERC